MESEAELKAASENENENENEAEMKETVDAVLRDTRKALARSKKMDAMGGWATGAVVAAMVFVVPAWLYFGAGFQSMMPEQHKLLVTLLHALPDQSERVNELLEQQGYVSIRQIDEITDGALHAANETDPSGR